MTILEVVVTLAILGAVLATVGQLTLLIAQQHRQGEAQRQTAQAAQNLIEHIQALPSDELNDASLAELVKSSSEAETIGLTIETDEPTEGSVSTREFTVVAKHRAFDGIQCRLVTWKHAAGEEP